MCTCHISYLLSLTVDPVEDFHPAYALTGTHVHHPPRWWRVLNCGDKCYDNIIVYQRSVFVTKTQYKQRMDHNDNETILSVMQKVRPNFHIPYYPKTPYRTMKTVLSPMYFDLFIKTNKCFQQMINANTFPPECVKLRTNIQNVLHFVTGSLLVMCKLLFLTQIPIQATLW